MQYAAAPLQGITTCVFRQVHHRWFPGTDCYYAPFFSPTQEQLITDREWRELDPARNEGIPVVPQIMTKKAGHFLWAAETMAGFGYREVNLNLGCPSGTVTAKGKGAGFLAHPAELDAFFYEIFSKDPEVSVSVKTRLGMHSPEEFGPILEIYNRYPISRLILHPRVQKDFYRVPVHMEAFEKFLPQCRMPVCYNGDLVTVGDCQAFSRQFPKVDMVMLGRGLAADPALIAKLHGGKSVDRETLRAFTGELYDGYCTAYGQSGPATQRMKELWFYLLHLFADREKAAKKMRRLSSPEEYETLADEIFKTLPLLNEAEGGF